MAGKSRFCPDRTKLLAARTPLVVVEYVRVSEVGVADCDTAAWKDQIPRPLGLANEAVEPAF
eukprot:scaffold115457_cov66-Phaeocystis_antarctica.AAC.2